jgi:lysophospholipid hydrolase
MVGVFLWMVNRQFHIRKSKHSYDKEPLRPLKPLKKAKKSSIKVLKKAKRNIVNRVKRKRGVTFVEDTDENVKDATVEAESEKPKIQFKSFSSFLDDVEEDEDIKPSIEEQSTKQPKKRGSKDLLQLVSKIEVFSYLSAEAADEILTYVEYVDMSSDELGKVIFDNNTLDGSLYAVVSGEVTMSLSVRNHNNESKNGHSFEFVAGPGEVMTSLLTLLSSLVREFQLQEAFVSSPIPGLVGSDFINVDVNGKPTISQDKESLIPDGFDVQALISAPNTCLLRIPSRCFVNILDRFPRDVHQICQTIVARLQRVTIQSLVRFLGLEDEVLGTRSKGYATIPSLSNTDQIPERKPRKTLKWKEFEESLAGSPSINTSLLNEAIPAAASLLGLPAEKSSLLREGASIASFPPGSTICRPGEAPDALYLIIKGTLKVSYGRKGDLSRVANNDEKQSIFSRKERSVKRISGEVDNCSSEKSLFSAGSGTFVELFSCFTGDSGFIDVHNPKSECDALLLQISPSTFEKIVSTHPRALIHCLLDIIDTIGSSPSVYLLDWTLDWMHVEAGESIATKGELCDSMFVVLNGRLRTGSPSTASSGDSSSSSDCIEYGRGDTIGGLEALAEDQWAYDVVANRNCEVARVSMSLMNVLMSIYPSACMHFAKVVAKMQSTKGQGVNKVLNAHESLLPSYGLSLATIAVIPLTSAIDVSDFCSSLTSSLRSIAPTKLLTKQETIDRIGSKLLTRPSSLLKMKMTRFLGDIEENNRLVVYQGDQKYTWWNKLAIQQADCVLVVVDSNNAPDLSLVEHQLSWAHQVKCVRVELVVVQSHAALKKSDEHASQEVNDWNENRPWVSKQHLVRAPFQDHFQDFNRMCRRITGQSIGLVLGAGGARGLAHLGVIRALNEAGISVDLVGGTSQGAFVGALYAKNPDDFGQLENTAREMAESMSSMKEKLLDLTFPITSFFNGSRFNHGIHKFLGDIRIQDLILNFYCVSVDIRNSCQVVHRKGITWKAVRASMTLAGYLPPMSQDNALLVDGGYMNVLPADVMKEFGAQKVIAVDVSHESVHDYYEYGMELSGFWLIWNSWNPFVKTVRVPSMGDINERLAWISSERYKKQVVENKIDLFLRPPVDDYGTLEFDKYDEIVRIGYEYAKPLVEQWAQEHGYFQNSSELSDG